MENRIVQWLEVRSEERLPRTVDAHRIGEVLDELFMQYERRFPDVRIAVVQTPISTY